MKQPVVGTLSPVFGSRAGYSNGTGDPADGVDERLERAEVDLDEVVDADAEVLVDRVDQPLRVVALVGRVDPRPVAGAGDRRRTGRAGTTARPPGLAAGSTRKTMIVSLRSPTRPLASPNAGAYGESGSTHAPLSAPVMRKFFAVGSAGGNVAGVVVSAAAVVGAGVVARPPTSAPGPSVATGVSGAGCTLGRVGDLDDVAVADDHVAGGAARRRRRSTRRRRRWWRRSPRARATCGGGGLPAP